MSVFDFFKKNNDSNKNNFFERKNSVEESYLIQINSLEEKGMPLDQIIIKFSNSKNFPIDNIIKKLSMNQINEENIEDNNIFNLRDGSKIVRTKDGVHAFRKKKEVHNLITNDMISNTNKDKISILDQLKLDENIIPELNTEIIKEKEVVKNNVKSQKKKIKSKFSMR